MNGFFSVNRNCGVFNNQLDSLKTQWKIKNIRLNTKKINPKVCTHYYEINTKLFFFILVVYQERQGSIDVKLKIMSDAHGKDRLGIKTSRYNKTAVDFFHIMDGVFEPKTKLWYFQRKQKEEIKSFFSQNRSFFTLI